MNLLVAPRRTVAAQIAWLPQRPYLGEFITCESIVAAARFRFQESPARAREEAHRILAGQGIAHLGPRPASQVSGGELQRVLVASLVAQDTPFLLVDEPANHLDPRHQVSTYRRLGQLWRNEGRAIVLVTHDVRLVRLLGPPEKIRILGVKAGRILPETHLADPGLAAQLADLYGVRYIDAHLPGGLSVDLDNSTETILP
jgi:iron complex transport system ATP-binding protein